MALVVADRVKETTTTSGTGTYDLGGIVTGFQSFATAIGNTNTTYYACTDGNNYEIGIGTYASTGNTLARTTILKSTNSNAAVNWGTSTKEIFVTYPAEKSVFKDASGDITGLTVNNSHWSGTDLAVANGGTGASTLTDGGVLLGSGTGAITAMAVLGDGEMIVGDGTTDPVAESGATLRTSIGVAIGSDVQAYDADLTALGGLAKTDSNFIVGNGSTWVAENGATARTSLGLGTAAVLDTGISDTNIAKFTSGVADNDFLRVDGTAIEGLNASEVLSEIGGQASLTFGKSDTNALKLEEAVSTNDILLAGSSNVKGRTYAELKSDLSLNNVENTALSTGTALNATNATHVSVADNESTDENNLITFIENASATGNVGLESDGDFHYNPSTGKLTATQLAGTLQTAAQANITSVGTLTGLTTSGDIELEGGTSSINWTAGNNQNDVTLLRSGYSSTTYGFNLKYMGSRTGTANSLSVFTDNSAGGLASLEAVTIFQDGKVGINDSTPTHLLDVNGTLRATGAVTFDSTVAATGTVTVGVDDTGHDVKFFGATSGKYMLWDESEDTLLFPDSTKATFGTDSDTTISHTGSRLELYNGTGSIIIGATSDDTDVVLQTDNGSGGLDTYVRADGSNGEVQLSHYGDIKLATKSTGVDVTGDLTLTSTDAGATDDPSLILKRDSSSPADYDNLGNIDFVGENSASEAITYSSISGMSDDVTDGTEDGRIRFSNIVNGTSKDIIDIGINGMVFRNEGNINWYQQNGSYNTILAGGTPTANRTITLPDATGTALVQDSNDDVIITSTDAGDTDDPSLILYRNSSSPADNDDLGEILFRGRNDNSQDVEYAKIWADAADVSDGAEDGKLKFVVMKAGTATNMLDLKGSGKTTFNSNDVQLATGVNLLFEGATSNANETTLTVADPTADRTITLPDATGTVLLQDSDSDVTITNTSDKSVLFIYRNSTSPADNDYAGEIVVKGRNDNSQDVEYSKISTQIKDVTDGTEDGNLAFYVRSNGSQASRFQMKGDGNTEFTNKSVHLMGGVNLIFEGATANAHETTLTVVDPTADRTITFPDTTGIVHTSGNSFGGTLLYSATLGSAAATLGVSSTYITDDYDIYEVVISDLQPDSTDNTWGGFRFGIGGTIQSASTDYVYTVYQIGRHEAAVSTSSSWGAWADSDSNTMITNTNNNQAGLGTGAGELFNGHFRFYNLRSTVQEKHMTHIDASWTSHSGYTYTTRKGLCTGRLVGNESNKVDTIQYLLYNGDIKAGAKIACYGYNKI